MEAKLHFLIHNLEQAKVYSVYLFVWLFFPVTGYLKNVKPWNTLPSPAPSLLLLPPSILPPPKVGFTELRTKARHFLKTQEKLWKEGRG